MTRTFAILALLLLAGTAQAADLPNPDITPGKVLTTDTAKICKPGYPKTVRPPASYTNRLKAKQLGMALHDKRLKLYEEDHLVSLELGGDPRDPLNLWPEAYSGTWGAKVKDRVEKEEPQPLRPNGLPALGAVTRRPAPASVDGGEQERALVGAFGGVAEWSIAAVFKTARLRTGLEGSNPSASAIFDADSFLTRKDR